MRAELTILALAREEHGSQVVEYALLIALVSIVLVLVFAASNEDLVDAFGALADRVAECFEPGAVTC